MTAPSKTLISIAILLGVAIRVAADDPKRALDQKTIREYLDKMQLKYVPHPRSADTIVVPITDNGVAERIDLYIELRQDKTLVLTAYPKLRGKYFNLNRAVDREKLLQKLLETNFRSFGTFFIDEQSDIGVRFTFTTEDGVGFDAFSVTVSELARIADEYTKTLDELMKKDEQRPNG
jgi:hypothetical protein